MKWKQQNNPITKEQADSLTNQRYYETVPSRGHDKIEVGDVLVYALLCVKKDENETVHKLIVVHPEHLEETFKVVRDQLVPIIEYK